uniref:Argonaute B2 n=1 Tax=Brachionus calyciflorus TaxID=104777 RepID=M4SIQ2_9BILA|nr:argonaute B2 [Brachionus calyciflorus]
MQFPPKPAQRGSEGRPIKLRTNHYRIKPKQAFVVYQYDVELKRKSQKEPADSDKLIKNKVLMRDMFRALESKLPPAYKNKMVYNFSKNLYSLVKLPFEESAKYELIVDRSPFIVTLKRINQVTVDFARYTELEIQVLDLIFTHNLNYSCVALNRSFFKEGANNFKLGFGLELWKGAYTSVRPSEVGLTWNLDTANAAFMLCKDLLELALNFYECDVNQLKTRISTDKKGSEIGYNYLKKHYNIDLKYPNLPCVDLGRQSYLPIELCSTELKNKKLDEKETQDMIKLAAVPAPDRMNYIDNWMKESKINQDPVLKQYNIDVELKMVELDGRVLEAPDVQYKGRKAEIKFIAEKGAWDHRNNKFFDAKRISKWLVVNFAFKVRDDALDNFIDALFRVGNIHGIIFENPLDVINETRRLDDATTKKVFENILTKYKGLELVVVIFGGTTNAYKIVKTCGDLMFGVPTQGVEDRNVNRLNEQTVSNILLKINSRVGGTNFILSRENRLFGKYIQQLYNGPLMVFGADVTHPSPGEDTDSIAAVVGSLDKECSYYGKISKFAYEMIHDLDKMMLDLLQSYFNQSKAYPKKIVFYRDGVSEGQFPLVLRHEINKMREACQKINPGYKPAITFVVVQKRHHTRLFPVRREDANGRAMNVPPGTVVDKDIVTRNMFDFFLCSHVGIQGTSRPCHYYVLHDDNEFSMNQLQILSHYLCHLYARCPRSVSYPAPAYYAHLAAFRGRDYIRSQKPLK